MSNELSSIKGICFGEVLWDNLPTGRKLGGAPLNVAYHLNKLGIFTQMLTRVGKDQNGEDLKQRCKELSIPLALFQLDDEYATSTVEVHINETKEVTYDIVFPVAWDFITCGEKELEQVKAADFFVFGSLSTRSKASYETLKKLLQFAKFKVLDINLRAPYYSQERIFELLDYADLAKLNEEELHKVSQWMNLPNSFSDREKVEALMTNFNLSEVVVTYGAKGAAYHSKADASTHYFPAFKVDVQDTIGSGDSFLAGLLSQRCQRDHGKSTEEMLAFAAMISGFVTQSVGACPDYDNITLNRFQWLKSIEKIGLDPG
ncbi:carbohydrate kinase family protein [Sphingobacterium sp. LRF_L2]|uniref:carbohydrate kinase family protein n=1 Tax=Sphingobacterium sp. LRF_L2 TaxID=3369421 RepID=UPI003F5F94B5